MAVNHGNTSRKPVPNPSQDQQNALCLHAESDQKQQLTCMDELSTWEVGEDEDGFQWSLFS